MAGMGRGVMNMTDITGITAVTRQSAMIIAQCTVRSSSAKIQSGLVGEIDYVGLGRDIMGLPSIWPSDHQAVRLSIKLSGYQTIGLLHDEFIGASV